MVKGINKRVIVVRSPDPRVFDEAIFIVRDDALKKTGVSTQEILREAQEVANSYLESNVQKKRRSFRRLSPVACLAIGAGLTGALWALTALL